MLASTRPESRCAFHRNGARPPAFLVSTTRHVSSIRESLGSATYSYCFVLEALAPVLERLGRWTLVEQPESRLHSEALRAIDDGYRPVHLAINPLQDVYLAPGLPNVLFPFWEFPDIPNRAFGFDTQQDWNRVARRANLIVTASRATSEAFERAGVKTPRAIVPVPLPGWVANVPAWDASHRTIISCRYNDLESNRICAELGAGLPPPPRRLAQEPAARSAARRAFQKFAPTLGPAWVDRIARARRAARGHSPLQVGMLAARHVYKRAIRDWLSDEAAARISGWKERALRRIGVARSQSLDPEIPTGRLELSGLVYTSFLSAGDPRKNPSDMLSAFLLAFRDRADVTLVIKLATNRRSAWHEVGLIQGLYESFGIAHACRVVVIADYLDDSGLSDLLRATTFYVNTSFAEGACLPLQHALAASRPAIAPDHTAMADYVDPSVAFVIGGDSEPCPWPHDPEQRLETERHRLHWSDIYEHCLTSARMVGDDMPGYRRMGESARARMNAVASIDKVERSLRHALATLEDAGQN